jgi:hypothetical protein
MYNDSPDVILRFVVECSIEYNEKKQILDELALFQSNEFNTLNKFSFFNIESIYDNSLRYKLFKEFFHLNLKLLKM